MSSGVIAEPGVHREQLVLDAKGRRFPRLDFVRFGKCQGGVNAGGVCQATSECPGSTCDGEIACTTNAQCAAIESGPGETREACRQQGSGAFRQGPANTITETGAAAGNMTDGLVHTSTLVSIFCVPPTYDAPDGNASIPGPGAAALVGQAQLLP